MDRLAHKIILHPEIIMAIKLLEILVFSNFPISFYQSNLFTNVSKFLFHLKTLLDFEPILTLIYFFSKILIHNCHAKCIIKPYLL